MKLREILNQIVKTIFGEKIPQIEYYEPYVEKDTECDLCEHLKECVANGYVVSAELSIDTRKHYIRGIDCDCYKVYGIFLNMKLSEVREHMNNDVAVELIDKSIKQFGDITYKEFLETRKINEIM